ncbi:hypothetical protein [Aliarcobacter butzleri]|uniref:hypothetical protein n=1 Tax=Aliarcobacter butzleri TaxID=28197 RepID=UPI0024DE2761|nr:hypothetical protein [Aliarcobacter butzleri]MDK2050876.1 hypothetical protein [Aliarcobacter butzleri]
MNYNTSILEIDHSRTNFANIILEEIRVCEASVKKRYIGSVNLLKVKGTTHPKYINKSWSELLDELGRKSPRAKSNIQHLKDNPNYYFNDEEKETWSFYKRNDDYYIDQGNHRTILARYFFYLNNITPIIHGIIIKEIN